MALWVTPNRNNDAHNEHICHTLIACYILQQNTHRRSVVYNLCIHYSTYSVYNGARNRMAFRGDLDMRTTKQDEFVRGRTRGSETRGTVPRIDRARSRARHQEEVKGNYRVLGSGGWGGRTAEGVGRERQGKPGQGLDKGSLEARRSEMRRCWRKGNRRVRRVGPTY